MNCVARQITPEIECKQWDAKSQTKDVHRAHIYIFCYVFGVCYQVHYSKMFTSRMHFNQWLMLNIDKDVCTFVTIYARIYISERAVGSAADDIIRCWTLAYRLHWYFLNENDIVLKYCIFDEIEWEEKNLHR